MHFKRKIAEVILLLFSIFVVQAQDLDYGLHIISYPSPATDFTSLALNDGLPLPTGGKPVTMEFQLCTRGTSLFGGVFRILTEKGFNIDLVYSFLSEGGYCVNLVNGDAVTQIARSIPLDRWLPVRICLHPGDGQIEVSYDNASTSIKSADLKGASKLSFSFGLCPYEGHTTNDAASVDIRDIRIYRGPKLIRNWALGVHQGDICLDKIQQSKAIARNPRWLIDQYITWKECLTLELSHEPSIAFDGDRMFYITEDGDGIRTFNAVSQQLERIPTSGVYPVNAPEELIWTGGPDPLLAYNLDDNRYASLSLDTHLWKGGEAPVSEHDYWNKTSGWYADKGLLCSFGGYGHYQYNNRLVMVDPTDPSSRKDLTLDAIDPRYSSASCIVDSLMFIFGGRGNKSGKQELSPHNFYDLYEVNLNTLDVKKRWEAKEGPGGTPFVPGAGLVFNREEQCFYVLSNIDGFTLYKIGMDEPLFEKMSLPIPATGSGQYVFKSLFLSSNLNKLYAVNNYSKVDGKSLLNIYELSYPPYPAAIVEQSSPAGEKKSWLGWLLTSMLVLALVIGALLNERKRKEKSHTASSIPADPAAQPYMKEASTPPAERPHHYDMERSSIRFFGGFKVMDAQGEDITHQFTPTLKTLLILLILYTAKNPTGIISGKLNGLLWPYKDEDAANNNRNVYMSKLRALLDKIGDIKVINQSKFWRIEFGEGTFCDYLEAKRLFGEGEDRETIDHLLELLLNGMMLPNLELDWVDEFKSDFSNETIDFLTRQIQRKDLDEKTIFAAADTIFQHDYLNEDALRAKCGILYRQGKAGLAKNCYDAFCKDYLKDLGMPYPVSFKSLIS